MAFDWKVFERELLEELCAALRRFAKQHRTEHFSAVALFGVYRELDGALSLPALGAHTTEPGAEPQAPTSFWSDWFNPHDWPYEFALNRRNSLRLERRLTAEATSATVGHWRAVERKYFDVLTRIARALRAHALELLSCTDDFVCFWHDEEGGPELARKTIDRALANRLFARDSVQKRRNQKRVGQRPRQRAAFLVSRFGQFEGVTSEEAQRELLAMGAAAIDALVGALTDDEHGWLAAKVLGQIGIVTPRVVTALRKRADGLWFAMALGMLGDHEWLMTQKPATAVNGLSARLKAITAGGAPRPLDYAPLEAWLAKNPKGRSRVENELAPGRSYVAIQKGDVDEAIRGLSSPFAVVRWHAASLLGDRELGGAGAKALPALARVLADKNALVRRLAVLSLSYWKAASRPYHATIRAMTKDSDPVVRDVAAKIELRTRG